MTVMEKKNVGFVKMGMCHFVMEIETAVLYEVLADWPTINVF